MRVVLLIELGRRAAMREHRLTNWHPWFAWYPVKLAGNDWRWLETVERRLRRVGAAGDVWTFADFRLPHTPDFQHAKGQDAA